MGICSSSVNDIASKTTPTNLTVVASGTSDNPFLFDRIQYAPDASVLLDNATVAVDAFDNQIHYSSQGWHTYDEIGMETTGKASLTFDFIGIQITWMTTLNYSDQATSSAQYSIDGGSLVEFQVAGGTADETAPHYNLVSFQTPVLSPGSHHLLVQYGANPDNAAPLRLDKLVIQNLTIPSFTPSPTTPSPTTIPVSRKLSAGALSGVIIGSLVGGAFIVFGLIWAIRFIKRKLATGQQAASYEACGDGQDN